jgi:tubulin-specific chaperone A
MPPPSQLAIATSSVRRLLKEESTYQKELITEEKKIKDLEQRVKNGEENEDGNAEFILKQHVSRPASYTPCAARVRQRIMELTTFWH